MRLTKFTDYALRILILAASKPDRNVTISEAAELYDISVSHLKKVVRTLAHEGFVEGKRGRFGGFKLALPPEEINLGAVIRATEPDFGVVECLLPNNACNITPICRLPRIVDTALGAMLDVFDQHSLADIALSKSLFDDLQVEH